MASPPPRPSAARAAGGSRASVPDRGGGKGAGGGGGKNDKAPGTFFLGRYRVVEEIGIGGMATVHLARMDGPGGFQKWVAIKRIHPNLVEDDQFVDMFLDEARIAAGINHANVAQVFDLGKDEGTYWIAMEYLHGEPLREIMRRCEERNQQISADLAARLCADAAEGLHAAHELRGKNGQLLGLVHRDVTPHNLFVTYEGYTKVVDFGIAKVADRLSETRAGTLKGKLAYMSPEQVRGQDDVDRTTDVFALGVVLWELTTGHRLFRMDTDLDTLEKVQACVVPPPSTIIPGYPIELESVVMKALAKKKPERYQTARELSRALQLYLQRRAVLIGPEEVSAFIRELFADRIGAREAHLAWAADVTSTINVDQLQALKAGRGKDSPLKSGDSEAPAIDPGRPSVPGQPNMGQRTGAPPQAQNVPAGPPLMTAPRPTVPQGPYAAGAQAQAQAQQNGRAPQPGAPGGASTPAPPPTVPGTAGARKSGLATTSLVDDDEDVPTTVATRDQVKDLMGPGPAAGRAPQPAAGRPHLPSIRETSMGLGHTIAIPADQNPVGPGMAPGMGPMGPGPGMAPAMQPPPQMVPTFGAPPPSQRMNPGGPMSSGVPPMMPPSGMMQGPPSSQIPQPSSSQPGYGPNPYAQQAMHNPLAGHPQGSGAFGQGMLGPNMGHQLPPGAMATGAQQMIAARAALKPSQIETALSIPRPDPSSMWLAQQAAVRSSQDKNTAVLIAVAVLTAICVIALGALIYLKSRPQPSPSPAPSGMHVLPDSTPNGVELTAPPAIVRA
ncbi:MAG: protein kinase [Polyangiaceae bacterium]|nr:protein kinase [Polyangiaceae bacterium]